MTKNLKRAGAIIAMTSALAVAGQAHAATYAGSWDPRFSLPFSGAPFSGLGWQGNAIFYIPDICLATDGLKANAGNCAGMSIISAEVEFYEWADPTKTIFESIFFTTPSTNVTSMTVTDGALSAVVGRFDYYEESDINGPNGGGDTSFQLRFIQQNLENLAQLSYSYYGPCREDDDECKKKEKERHEEEFAKLCEYIGLSQIEGGGGNGKPLISFERLTVPEPGSIALLVPAFGILAAVRRRRSAAA